MRGFLKNRLRATVAVAIGIVLVAGAAATVLTLGQNGSPKRPNPTPTATASVSTSATVSASPTATASRTPTPSARPSGTPTPQPTLRATVIGPQGANIRSGAGMDQPVVGFVTTGTALTFNGWFHRASDPPQPDAVTGRVEAWSQDWMHMADGRGWIHDAVLNARPAGLPQLPWTPPPAPTQNVVTIAAPVYKQTMNLDCETSALRVALAYYGHYYTDAQLFAEEPVDLRPPVMGPNHTIRQWGNPYTHFVGDVNGIASIPTGYGVYYPVIVNLARTHGLPNAIGGEGYAASTIYAALAARHPVEVWIQYDWETYAGGVWTAWDGTRVRYTYGEHAVTLTGVSTTEVRVNDVGHGNQYWISKATFEASWAAFNNMAVIF